MSCFKTGVELFRSDRKGRVLGVELAGDGLSHRLAAAPTIELAAMVSLDGVRAAGPCAHSVANGVLIQPAADANDHANNLHLESGKINRKNARNRVAGVPPSCTDPKPMRAA